MTGQKLRRVKNLIEVEMGEFALRVVTEKDADVRALITEHSINIVYQISDKIALELSESEEEYKQLKNRIRRMF